MIKTLSTVGNIVAPGLTSAITSAAEFYKRLQQQKQLNEMVPGTGQTEADVIASATGMEPEAIPKSNLLNTIEDELQTYATTRTPGQSMAALTTGGMAQPATMMNLGLGNRLSARRPRPQFSYQKGQVRRLKPRPYV
jgi:hypothetical protein